MYSISRFFFKLSHEIIFTDIKMGGQHINGNSFREIVFQITKDFFYDGFLMAFRLRMGNALWKAHQYFRQPGIMESVIGLTVCLVFLEHFHYQIKDAFRRFFIKRIKICILIRKRGKCGKEAGHKTGPEAGF